jgi:hypothetical protein
MTYVALREQKKRKKLIKALSTTLCRKAFKLFLRNLKIIITSKKKSLYYTGMIQIIQISVRNPNPYKMKTAENSKKKLKTERDIENNGRIIRPLGPSHTDFRGPTELLPYCNISLTL